MINQLKRRRAMLNRCYMCKIEEKLTDHLLLHCLKASTLQQLFSLFGMVWVIHFVVRGTLLSWYGSFVGRNKKNKIGRQLLCVCFRCCERKQKGLVKLGMIRINNCLLRDLFSFFFFFFLNGPIDHDRLYRLDSSK